MASSEINRQEMVHYFKSFTSSFSLFLLIEDLVTLICSKEGFQYLCLSRGWINLALQSNFPTIKLCILIHVLQSSQFTEPKFENKSFWKPDMAIKTLQHKTSMLRDFKLRPKYSEPRVSIAFQNNWNQSSKGTGSTWEGEGRRKARRKEEGIELVLQLSQRHGCNSSQGLKFERLCCLIKKCYLDL